MALLKRYLESRNLPPMDLLRFNGNPSHWPEFIQYFKETVYMKRTFSDSLRMEHLLSVLDGDAKRVVSATGRNGLFYAIALKALKREFGNLYVVSFLKLKAVLDQSQIQTGDQKGLKQFHQQLKTVITWLTSMGYFSSINSTENVTKAVMRLPKNLRTSYYKSFDDTDFNENNINLISPERWLANEIRPSLNPIATIIESTVRSKGSGNQGDKSNKLKHDNKNHRLNANSSQSQSGDLMSMIKN